MQDDGLVQHLHILICTNLYQVVQPAGKFDFQKQIMLGLAYDSNQASARTACSCSGVVIVVFADCACTTNTFFMHPLSLARSLSVSLCSTRWCAIVSTKSQGVSFLHTAEPVGRRRCPEPRNHEAPQLRVRTQVRALLEQSAAALPEANAAQAWHFDGSGFSCPAAGLEWGFTRC